MNLVCVRDSIRVLLLALSLAGAAGCAAVARIPPEQAAEVDTSKGLVFGSIRISVDSSLPDTSPGFAPGRKTVGANHYLRVECATTMQRVLGFIDTISLPLTLGDELIVVRKLQASHCDFLHVAEGGFLLPMISRIGFVDVQAGWTSYFGAIELSLPTVLAAGSQSRSTIADEKTRTREVLRPEYGSLFDDAVFQVVVLSN